MTVHFHEYPTLDAPVQRLAAHVEASLSAALAALLDARRVVLAIQGTAKRAVWACAMRDADPLDLPIAAVLRQTRAPVDVFLAR